MKVQKEHISKNGKYLCNRDGHWDTPIERINSWIEKGQQDAKKKWNEEVVKDYLIRQGFCKFCIKEYVKVIEK